MPCVLRWANVASTLQTYTILNKLNYLSPLEFNRNAWLAINCNSFGKPASKTYQFVCCEPMSVETSWMFLLGTYFPATADLPIIFNGVRTPTY